MTKLIEYSGKRVMYDIEQDIDSHEYWSTYINLILVDDPYKTVLSFLTWINSDNERIMSVTIHYKTYQPETIQVLKQEETEFQIIVDDWELPKDFDEKFIEPLVHSKDLSQTLKSISIELVL